MPVREDVRNYLMGVAGSRRAITYRDLGIALSIPYEGKAIGKILGEISEDEVRNGRPPLSSIVVLHETIGDALCPDGYPARGFLGCFFVPARLSTEDDVKRWMRKMQLETWKYWGSHPVPAAL